MADNGRRADTTRESIRSGRVWRRLPTVSVVIPVLDEEDTLPELHRRVEAALEGIPHELVFVDDGSTDRSAAIVEELAARQEGIVLVQLSRNFGMEIAMSAGLDHARGDYVVLMHADLQDPPELIPEMLEKARAGRRRRLRAPDRPRRELAQARAGDRLLRADGAPGAHALPGPGGRLPADVAARRRDAAPDARAPPLPARDGRLGRLRAGADRVPPRGPHGRPRRLLPRAAPARGRGARLVLGRAAGARGLLRDRDRGAREPGRGRDRACSPWPGW